MILGEKFKSGLFEFKNFWSLNTPLKQLKGKPQVEEDTGKYVSYNRLYNSIRRMIIQKRNGKSKCTQVH
jgi:hypothetical protein